MSFFPRIRQLASETAVYGIASILGRMVNFLLFPFYSQVFPPEQFTPVIVVYAAFIFLNILYQYGMESAYLKFASDASDEAAKQVTFSTATWTLLGTSLLLSLGMVALRGPVGDLVGLDRAWLFLLYYAALILLLDTLTAVPFAELRLTNRPWHFAAIRLVNVAVNVGLNLLLILVFEMGITSIFIANAAASAVTLLLLLPTYRQKLRWTLNRPLLQSLLLFGLPFVPGGLGYAVTERVNIFFLQSLPPERVRALYGDAVEAGGVVGVYGGIIKLAIFMALVTQMFRFAWQPFFLQHARDEDARALFARVFTLFTAVLLFVLLGLSFFVKELVSFPLPGGRHLIDAAYWPGLFIVPIALLGYLFQGWYYTFSAGAYIEKQTRYFIHCTLAGSALSLGLNAWLVPRYGMLAAAWSTTLSYALMAVLLHLIVRRFYAVPYDWKRVLGMGAWAALLFFAWDRWEVLQHAGIEVLLLMAFAGSLFALRILSPAMVRRILTRRAAGPKG